MCCLSMKFTASILRWKRLLYPAMEDGELDLIIGEDPRRVRVRIELPPFTLVGATTRLGF